MPGLIQVGENWDEETRADLVVTGLRDSAWERFGGSDLTLIRARSLWRESSVSNAKESQISAVTGVCVARAGFLATLDREHNALSCSPTRFGCATGSAGVAARLNASPT